MIAFLLTMAMGLYAISTALECAARSQRRYERRIQYVTRRPEHRD